MNKSIEQFGSGFKRIDSLCKDAGVKYSYETPELGFSFILSRTPIQNVTVNKTEEAVLALLRIHSDYTREQLAESTAKTVRTIQRVLNSLKEKNLIERKGSDKDGIWVVL